MYLGALAVFIWLFFYKLVDQDFRANNLHFVNPVFSLLFFSLRKIRMRWTRMSEIKHF